MYLARFETDEDEWVQATVALDAPGAHAPRASVAAYWDEVGWHLAEAARLPAATVAHRITLDERRRLCQIVSVTVRAVDEERLRAFAGRLTRLDRQPGVSVLIAQRRSERDAWMARLGDLRARVPDGVFAVGGVPLACDFRLAPVLDALFEGACLDGHALVYQVHVRTAAPDAAQVRAVRRAALALADVPGVRPALAACQEALARALGTARAVCEEYLAAADPAAARAAEARVEAHFRDRYAALGFPDAGVRFVRGAHHEALTLGIHRHELEPPTPAEAAGAALGADARDGLLAWRPGDRLTARLATAEAEPAGEPSARPVEGREDESPTLPPPYEGAGAYAFVSYKREDLARIAPLLIEIRARGVPLWYDEGIPGGAEWDAVIEERLAGARFVLLFASDAAVHSKYVRREVKFADALDVPVLTVVLEDVRLGHGMHMLLTQYQMLDARMRDFPNRLARALAHLR